MKALILAAGYATRLYPLTKEYPKPLLKVGKRPIIDFIVDKLVAVKEIDEIIVVTNSKFISRFKEWKKGLKASVRVTLVDDLTKDNATRLGAVGDMNFAIHKLKIKDDLIVIGGDNLFDGGIGQLISFANSVKKSPVIGVYDIGKRSKAVNYGVMKLNKEKRIVDFQEKPLKPKSTLVGMCLYYFPKRSLGMIKEYLKVKLLKNDATGLYIDWLSKNMAVYGLVFKGSWYDIGDLKFYNEAKETFVN